MEKDKELGEAVIKEFAKQGLIILDEKSLKETIKRYISKNLDEIEKVVRDYYFTLKQCKTLGKGKYRHEESLDEWRLDLSKEIVKVLTEDL